MDGVDLEVHEPRGLLFCQYHLPMSAQAQVNRFGRSGGANKGHFKEAWSVKKSADFAEDIKRQIAHAFENNIPCDLSGVVFPGPIDFSSNEMPSISFADCHFAGPITVFDGLNFKNADVSFRSAQFTGGSASFVATAFSGGTANFEDTKFTGGAVNFARAQFSGGEANFNKTDFSGGDAVFRSAQFSGGGAYFQRALFSGGHAHFDGAEFSGGSADFEGAEFPGHVADFQNAKFSGAYVSFRDAKFFDAVAFFAGAEFSDTVYFDRSSAPSADGQTSNTFRSAHFHDATFNADVWFNNQSFLCKTSFDDTTFGRAPEFHGCALHQDTTFPPLENFKDTQTERAAHAYRTLRLAMKQQEAHEEEAMFWALEQRSKRNNLDLKKPKNWLPWALSWGYDLLSNYGLNAGLPVRWLGGWVVYSTVIYACAAGSLEKLAGVNHWLGALGFSIAQMARPFFIWGDYDGTDIKAALGSNEFSFLIKMLATVDSIVSLTLVALFILAVRRRFRMQ